MRKFFKWLGDWLAGVSLKIGYLPCYLIGHDWQEWISPWGSYSRISCPWCHRIKPGSERLRNPVFVSDLLIRPPVR